MATLYYIPVKIYHYFFHTFTFNANWCNPNAIILGSFLIIANNSSLLVSFNSLGLFNAHEQIQMAVICQAYNVILAMLEIGTDTARD